MNPKKVVYPTESPKSRSPEMCQGYFQPVKAHQVFFFKRGNHKTPLSSIFAHKSQAQPMIMACVNRTRTKMKKAA
jgi:hypothetical protein